MKRKIFVRVEKLDERYNGEKTGNTVFHTSLPACTREEGIHGCPMGRGYTPALSLKDFVIRCNADGANITRDMLEIIK